MIQMALQILIVVAISIKLILYPQRTIFLNSVGSVILFLLLDSWRL